MRSTGLSATIEWFGVAEVARKSSSRLRSLSATEGAGTDDLAKPELGLAARVSEDRSKRGDLEEDLFQLGHASSFRRYPLAAAADASCEPNPSSRGESGFEHRSRWP
jgi:hypothetical protein